MLKNIIPTTQALILLVAFSYSFQASAVAFKCNSEDLKNKTSIKIDSDGHLIKYLESETPIMDDYYADPEYRDYLSELHVYLDSVNLGSDEVLKKSLEVEKEVSSTEKNVPVTFENGMTLIYNKDDSKKCLAKKKRDASILVLGFKKDKDAEEESLCCEVD